MMFIVDTVGSGSTDHAVPVIGYDDRGADGLWYGMYTTWSEDETVVWEPFRGIRQGTPWGISSATFVRPLDAPVPEPTSMSLMTLAALSMIVMAVVRNKPAGNLMRHLLIGIRGANRREWTSKSHVTFGLDTKNVAGQLKSARSDQECRASAR
jgi:hypothetical protein